MPRSDPLDILSEASGILASSFGLSDTLPQVANLCVREFADYCAIAITQQGKPGYVVESTLEPALTGIAKHAGGNVSEALHVRGLQTVVRLPICGRNEILGTFILSARQPDAFSLTTQKVANILALHIANAVDQATLFERTYRVADRLQRALLPETFPRVPGAVFHGAYRPASDEAEVGGDWYDAFAMPDGRVAISVGDVAGHGLDAATIMGEVRQALRAAAVGSPSPAAVLDTVNGVISLRGSIGMVTAIFGYYTPRNRELTYAVAGHPPPLVTIRNGISAFLPGGGLPLGVASSISASDWTLTLPPETQVTFYTDGMTEYGRDLIEGESALLEAASDRSVRYANNPAERLQEHIFERSPNRDDAAALVLTCEEGPVPPVLRFTATPIAAPLARASMYRLAEQIELGEDRAFSLVSAVGEAIANAVEHAYRGEAAGTIGIFITATPEDVTIMVEDGGRWKPFAQREERGRGIALMHDLVDGVSIRSSQNKTCVALTLARNRATA